MRLGSRYEACDECEACNEVKQMQAHGKAFYCSRCWRIIGPLLASGMTIEAARDVNVKALKARLSAYDGGR